MSEKNELEEILEEIKNNISSSTEPSEEIPINDNLINPKPTDDINIIDTDSLIDKMDNTTNNNTTTDYNRYPQINTTKLHNIMSTDGIKKSRRSNLLYTADEVEWYTKFNRFGVLDPEEELRGTKEYIFFVKPDLHLFNNGDDGALNPELADNPYFISLFQNNTNFPVLRQLQISNNVGNKQSPFMNVLSSAVKSSLDLPGVNADKTETAANIYGTKMEYMWSTYTTDEESDFSLEFGDTKYLEVYNIFKAWIEYNRLKSIGLVSPPSDNYILNQELHDVTCVYKFIVEDDGETIVHYSKIYGVFPLSYPRDIFGNLDKNGGLSFSIQFNGGFVDDSPNVLADFNVLTKPYLTNAPAPIFDTTLGAVNGDWVGAPYIVQRQTTGSNGRTYFKLKWCKV